MGQRVICLWLLVIFVGVVLASCAGSNGPEETAQRYVDALIREDFEAAADEVDAGRMGREGVIAVLPFLRAELIRQNGTLRSASVERLERDDDSEATMLVTWRGASGELASSLILARVANEWKIVDMPADVPGARGPRRIEPPSGNGARVPAATQPLSTPTPTHQTVAIRLTGLDGLTDQARYRIVVEAEELNQRLMPGRDNTWTAPLPLGRHTLRVSLPGRADAQASVEVTGARTPETISAKLGDRLPIDVNTTMLAAGPYSTEWSISSIGPAGLVSLEINLSNVRGLDRSGLTIQFADSKGLGTVGLDGSKTYQWQRPEINNYASSGAWAYGPDFEEIAYVENNDIWTLETKPGAEPKRWTALGIFRSLIGFFDADTLVVQGQSERHVLHRDGTSYTYEGTSFDRGLAPILDKGGDVRFLEAEGVYFQPGPAALVKRAQITPSYTGVSIYGWTADRKYYLVHSAAQEQDATSGVVALSLDGTARSLAGELRPTAEYYEGSLEESIREWAFAPRGSRMALVWTGEQKPGVYVMDAAGGGAERLLELTPNRLYWPLDQNLVYVIENGADMGTWLQPVNGGTARKLFAYRATNVTASPDGTLLLIANNTLWRVDSSGEPRIIGEEGRQAEIEKIVWFEPKS